MNVGKVEVARETNQAGLDAARPNHITKIRLQVGARIKEISNPSNSNLPNA